MNIPTLRGTPVHTTVIQVEQIISIRDTLSISNANLLANRTASTSVNRDTTQQAITTASASRWADFSLEVLTEVYKNILDQMVMPPRGVRSGTFDIRRVQDATTMFIEHLSPPLEEPISRGAAFLGGQSNRQFPAVVVKVSNDIKLNKGVETYNPPLSFVTGDGARTLVVGFFLHARAWNSNKLLHTETAMAKRPLLRIAKYCLLAHTRYGFIMTMDEIVVVRIKGTVFDTKAPCHVEWQAVPWVAQGPYELTVCLSMWSLVMLSLDDLRLSTSPSHYMPPPHHIPHPRSLNIWWHYQIPGGFFYRHPSSGQREADLPEGATFEEGPTETSSSTS
ncbi:uncharacterized protein BKA55DRAFT_541307 [Fusarium redolens]|uniref:Uncharacterized protein n=1 Tax=Fusarium redolens TaxID=48865 RepID=A0A9P9GUK4_FUSRE|nr:uncharacterized protein BKA55DRAFT_541307 [Fusarium redolens]KAH7244402.1 hypothetical protein BKA55DRAFT_541307 [Fusarium redolens]